MPAHQNTPGGSAHGPAERTASGPAPYERRIPDARTPLRRRTRLPARDGTLTSDGDGTLIGSGDGAVHGPKLTGTLEWTLFEHPGSTLCAMAPLARITTGDGAQIQFEGRGYAARPSQSDPTWRVAATLYLTTGDSRYSWLDGALALWEGEFNEVTHHARYRAFLQPATPVP